MNIYNSFTAQQLAEMGAQMAVISPEMHLRHARDIAGGCEKIITVYGKLPLMLLKNCPVKAQIGCKKCGGNGALTDRMGKVFPVKCRMGFSELFNCVPLCLDKLKDFEFAHYALICITDEDKTQAANIVSGYIDNKIQTPDEFTRGLYFRNVE